MRGKRDQKKMSISSFIRSFIHEFIHIFNIEATPATISMRQPGAVRQDHRAVWENPAQRKITNKFHRISLKSRKRGKKHNRKHSCARIIPNESPTHKGQVASTENMWTRLCPPCWNYCSHLRCSTAAEGCNGIRASFRQLGLWCRRPAPPPPARVAVATVGRRRNPNGRSGRTASRDNETQMMVQTAGLG